MRRLATKLLIGLALAAATMVALSASVERATRTEASPIDTIVLGSNPCIALLAASAPGDDASRMLFSCQQPEGFGGGPGGGVFHAGQPAANLQLLAAAGSQKNRRDDQFQLSEEQEGIGFSTCNEFPEIADDIFELLCSLDQRDGALDGNISVQRSDFAGLNLDLNHLHERDGTLLVIGFFNNDNSSVVYRTTDGRFVGSDDPQVFVCAAVDIAPMTPGLQIDEDCDGDGVAGDGAVVVRIVANAGGSPPLPRGEGEVLIGQDGVAAVEPIRVVGEPATLNLQAFEDSMEAGLTQAECPLGGSAPEFIEALGRPDKTIMLAKVLDSDGTEVTGAFLSFESSDPDRLLLASPLSASLDLGQFGAGAPNIFCGGSETGPATLTVTLLDAGGQGGLLGVQPEIFSGSDVATHVYTILEPGTLPPPPPPPPPGPDGLPDVGTGASGATSPWWPAAVALLTFGLLGVGLGMRRRA
jgi:hypothetical protein